MTAPQRDDFEHFFLRGWTSASKAVRRDKTRGITATDPRLRQVLVDFTVPPGVPPVLRLNPLKNKVSYIWHIICNLCRESGAITSHVADTSLQVGAV